MISVVLKPGISPPSVMGLKFVLTTVVLLLLVARAHAARQSPIDIIEDAVVTASLPDLEWRDYSSSRSQYAIENTGHTAEITLTNSHVTPAVTGGPLRGKKFKLQQAHFHWGKTAQEGSEHLLNGKSASMEAHLVHYNSGYGSYEEAATKPDGLAVVGIFIAGGKNSRSFNNNFQRVVEGVKRVQSPKDKVLTGSDLLRWVASHLKPRGYFTYKGSLTSEPFSENVIWIVYKDPVLINADQVAAFRQMHGFEHDLLENFREVQPLDGRVVDFVRGN